MHWLASNDPITLPRRALQSVRLMLLPDELLEAWNRIGATPGMADVVVIRQNNRLQPIEGVVGEMDDAKLRFQFEGDGSTSAGKRLPGYCWSRRHLNQGLPRGTLVTGDWQQNFPCAIRRDGQSSRRSQLPLALRSTSRSTRSGRSTFRL